MKFSSIVLLSNNSERITYLKKKILKILFGSQIIGKNNVDVELSSG